MKKFYVNVYVYYREEKSKNRYKQIGREYIASTNIVEFTKYLYALYNHVEILPFGSYDMKIKIKCYVPSQNASKTINDYLTVYKKPLNTTCN